MYFVILIFMLPAIQAFFCDERETTCKTTLEISHRQTMYHGNEGPVYARNGTLYSYKNKPVPADEVIIGDGYTNSRLVIAVNNTLPGPDIIVYEGQRLIIDVKNNLASESTTIHWHGLPQEGSPWSDGVGFISQCPILPGQTFTYNFTATPKGTYWYHSHVGVQRTEGLFGSLVIREKESNSTFTMNEHFMQVTGWNHNQGAIMDELKKSFGETGELAAPGGGALFPLEIHSVLINGRAMYKDSKNVYDPPLSSFDVSNGTQYRFRIINSDASYPIKVSFDNHRLLLVASDGYDLIPEPADAIITNPGERYDVIITTNQTAGNYWVRAETLTVNKIIVGQAILHYDGIPLKDPSSTSTRCTPTNECLHLNCPFAFYPPSYNTNCKNIGSFKSAANDDPAPLASGSNFKEVFLNFGFAGFKPAINEKNFILPTVSALTQPNLVEPKCTEEKCGKNGPCSCVHTLDIDYNDTVQFVLTNTANEAHPIHLHGYSYYVLKTGYGILNTTTASLIALNMDIDCQNTAKLNCFNATWSNSSWLNGNVPDVEIMRAPRKDTLLLPGGSYAVLRIRADNPGNWFMHCHIDSHAAKGMAIMLKVSSPPNTPLPIPDGLPTCHSFNSELNLMPSVTTAPPTTTTEPPITTTTSGKPAPYESCPCTTPVPADPDLPALVWITFGVLCFIIFVLIVIVICLCKTQHSKSVYLENTDNGAHSVEHSNKGYLPSEN